MVKIMETLECLEGGGSASSSRKGSTCTPLPGSPSRTAFGLLETSGATSPSGRPGRPLRRRLSSVVGDPAAVGGDFSSSPATAEERARDLFQALDKNGDKFLTKEAFVQGYLERNELLARQDAQEQRRKLDFLVLR